MKPSVCIFLALLFVGFVFADIWDTAIPDSCKVYRLHFENTLTDTFDSHDGSGPDTAYATGYFGQAVSLAKGAHYVKLANPTTSPHPTAGAFIGYWVWHTDIDSSQALNHEVQWIQHCWFVLRMNDTGEPRQIQCYVRDAAANVYRVQSTYEQDDSTWYYIAFYWDGSYAHLKIYCPDSSKWIAHDSLAVPSIRDYTVADYNGFKTSLYQNFWGLADDWLYAVDWYPTQEQLDEYVAGGAPTVRKRLQVICIVKNNKPEFHLIRR